MDIKKLKVRAYNLYVADWLNQRNISILDVDFNDTELNFYGEIFACFDEFENNEFQDREYMWYLLSNDDFELWKSYR